MSKQKIKIMDKRMEVSEEEIRSYMNFDEVLARRNTIAKGWGKNFLKWSIPVITTIAVLLWQSMNHNDLKSDNGPKPVPSCPEPVVNRNESISETPGGINSTVEVNADSAVAQPSSDIKSQHVTTASKKKLSLDLETPPVRVVEIDSPTAKSEFKAYTSADPVLGYDHLYKYFNDNLRYPEMALKDSVEGVLNVNFVINEEGRPEQISFANSFGAPFEQEAIRLIEAMPAWKPALLNGRPVKSKVSLPLTFKYEAKKAIESLFQKKRN